MVLFINKQVNKQQNRRVTEDIGRAFATSRKKLEISVQQRTRTPCQVVVVVVIVVGVGGGVVVAVVVIVVVVAAAAAAAAAVVVAAAAAAAAAAVAVKMISKPFRLKFKILDIQHPFVSSCFVALVSTFP